ncbi:MAG: hypothetical protein AAF799_41645 [Myxococcota bacterium]
MVSLSGLVVACSVETNDPVFDPAGLGDDDSTGTTPSITAAAEGSATSETTTAPSSGDGVDEGSGETDSILLDVGSTLDLDPGGKGGGEGCEKIDFLFVIDNSNSMSDEQAQLVAAFPGFVDAIVDTLPDATDFHVGVTRTDVQGFDDTPTPDPSNPCAYVMGGLLSHGTEPDDHSGLGPDCGFSSGANYMVNSPSLTAEFECVAPVGTRGNTGERQAEATLAALSPAAAQASECSEGFLRSDALLVVVVITDEDDDWSAPDTSPAVDVQAWTDELTAAKGGIESNVVFLLISGGSPSWDTCGPLDFGSMTGADDSPKLTAWAQNFSNHVLGNVCEAGYEAYLQTAISTIETACIDFEPEG